MPAATTLTSPAELRGQLQLLEQEHALAGLEGLAADAHYMADLRDEIASTRAAYVGGAVTEIACLRAAVSGALLG